MNNKHNFINDKQKGGNMTKDEKQKAIGALKKSAPFMAMTQEEYTDYIQTINKIIDLLELESYGFKADYEARLKADKIDMLEGLDLQINEIIRDRIDKLKEENNDDPKI